MSIVDRIEAQIATRGDRVALVHGERTLSYAALDAAANSLARAILDTDGELVPICAVPGMGRIIAAFASLRAGRAYVPIDVGLHDAGIRDLLAHTQARCVVVDATTEPRLRGLAADNITLIDIRTCDAAPLAPRPAIRRAPNALAYLRYTSGSTGAPKGVMHTQRSAQFLAQKFCDTLSLTPEDRVTVFGAFWHSMILGTLMTGGQLHLFDLQRDGLRTVAAGLARQQVTAIVTTPVSFRAIATALGGATRLNSVHWLSLSGEPVTRLDLGLARKFLAASCRVLNGYGSSEFDHIASGILTETDFDTRGVPAGFPLPGIEVCLVDAKGQQVAPGTPGEIAVRCAAMSAGYWRNPELTRAVFRTDGPASTSGLYRTGDIGRFGDDGRLYVLGRTDSQIKLRGFRVLPEEIESALLNHPDVAAAAVRAFGEPPENPRLAAFIVPTPGAVADAHKLRSYARERLPDYMVPAIFLACKSLPMTAGGKLDRNALPDPRHSLSGEP